MKNSLHLARVFVLPAAALLISMLVLPLIIGYGNAQMTILGAVPGYFATCVPGWSVLSWYEHDELFIPVDELQRYLDKGCPGVERIKFPPGEYISNSVFLFFERNLDRWYFIGYRAGEDHAIGTILPTWNQAFKDRELARKAFVSILAFLTVGFFAFGMHLLKRHI